MKNNRLACLVSLPLVTFTPACGPEVLAPRPLDPDGKSVTLNWSFDGSSCAQKPEITEVRVQIGDEPLESAGRFPCNAHGLDGVTLTHFSPGQYSYIITAYLPKGRGTYQDQGHFQVGTQDVVAPTLLHCLYSASDC